MLALLYCLSMMSRHNELSAMRASGVSLARVVVPYLCVGAVCAVAVFFLSEQVVSRSFRKAEEFISWKRNRAKAIRPFFYANQTQRREWMADEFRVRDVTNPEMSELVRVKVWELSSRNVPLRIYNAATATWREGVWYFRDVVTVPFDEAGLPAAGFKSIPAVAELPVRDFSETPDTMRRAATLRKPDYMSVGELQRRIDDTVNPPPESAMGELRMAYYDRFAFPWICVVVVLIGIPFGITTDRRGTFLGVANSLGLFFVYYFFINIDRVLGQNGYVPPLIAAWLPNVAFAIIGVLLLRRVR